MHGLANLFLSVLRDAVEFAELGSGVRLRSYQVAAAREIIASVLEKRGDTFVVIFPRQSGKNELQAQIESYLLTVFSNSTDAEIVKASPTWKPQSQNAMRRLERSLKRNLITRDRWTKEQGYIYRIGDARIYFLSGAPTSQIVGATASLLLEVDEAQDVQPAKYDKDLAPMAASTNATRVFWGTAWTSRSLLAREYRAAQSAEQADGRRRTFLLTAETVGAEVPAYARFVAEQTARLGRNHPLIKTQFFSEEIDAEGGLFPPARIALTAGAHPAQLEPTPGKIYAFLLDVAGADETATEDPSLQPAGKRDSTALTIVECDLSTLADELVRQPTYKVVHRHEWINTKQSYMFAIIRALNGVWQPRYIVVDATGIGAGLASFLDKAIPGKVIPFIFTLKSKSDLGWNFIAAIESGRFKDYVPADYAQGVFREQLANVEYTAEPGRMLRWAVPDGTRSLQTGQLVHDDYVMSAALAAVLDDRDWFITDRPVVIQAADPLEEIDSEGF